LILAASWVASVLVLEVELLVLSLTITLLPALKSFLITALLAVFIVMVAVLPEALTVDQEDGLAYWHCVVFPLSSGTVVAVQSDVVFAYAEVTTVGHDVTVLVV